MTFDFTPDWLLGAIAATEYSGTAPHCGAVSPLAPPPPCAPSHPTMAELAALVAELFAEGTLSWDQLRALGGVPELRPMLSQAIASVPPTRRAARSRP